jgi:hypothetical protein
MGVGSDATSEADVKRHAVVVTANYSAGFFEYTNSRTALMALIERVAGKL